MRRLTWVLASLLVGTLLIWWAVHDRTRVEERAEEYVRPFEAAANHYYTMLLSERFVDLDQAIVTARREDATLSDGQPLVAAIFGGASGCISNGCSNTLTPDEWKRRGALLEKWKRSASNSIAAEIAAAEY